MAADLHTQCLAALEATGDVTISCDGVERVDAAVLQCLLALSSSLAEGHRSLELIDRSEPFGRAVEVLGFDTLLGG